MTSRNLIAALALVFLLLAILLINRQQKEGYLFADRKDKKAFLINQDGQIIHTWQEQDDKSKWHHIELDADQNLLAITKDHWLSAMSFDSEVLWSTKGAFHHDLDFDQEGNIWILERRKENVPEAGLILNEYITLLSPKGERVSSINILPIIKEILPQDVFIGARTFYQKHGASAVRSNTKADILHNNSIDYIEEEGHFLPQGSLLISSFSLNFIYAINPETKKLLWYWPEKPQYDQMIHVDFDRKVWSTQRAANTAANATRVEGIHQASFLQNGNVLLFDNGFWRGYSRILEINPRTSKIVWSYGDRRDFSSPIRGGVEKLNQSGYLITSSLENRLFEVNQKGEKIWELDLQLYGAEEMRAEGVYRVQKVLF